MVAAQARRLVRLHALRLASMHKPVIDFCSPACWPCRQETAVRGVPGAVCSAVGGQLPGHRRTGPIAGAMPQHDCADARAAGRHRRSSRQVQSQVTS